MKIITWNVNGLRALHRDKKLQQILDMDPDVIMLQETKASPDQLPPEMQKPAGYYSAFASSEARKGYSGVATYSKTKAHDSVAGLDIERFDEQGRVLTHFYDEVALINAYFPNGASKTAPLDYKLDFFDEFLQYVDRLKEEGYKVVIGGDINVAHEEIDLARPRENKHNIGFLPEERAWIDEYIRYGLVDVYRHFNPTRTEAYTYWDLRTRARERNVGWRLDYFFVTSDLLREVSSVNILSDIYGSDHCPVEMTLSINV